MIQIPLQGEKSDPIHVRARKTKEAILLAFKIEDDRYWQQMYDAEPHTDDPDRFGCGFDAYKCFVWERKCQYVTG
jgi:hypothetical protein